jgi:chemotaxis protein MotB
MDPARLAVIGLGEYRPAQTNDTPEGRNANRRVVLVILGGKGMPEGPYGKERGDGSDAPPAATSTQAGPPIVETAPQIVTPAGPIESAPVSGAGQLTSM